MAQDGKISHNAAYLSDESLERLDAVIVGENVAVADSVDRIHSLFMGSPPHRHNILEPEFKLVGVGAIRTEDGDLFLTEDFLTRRAPSPPHDGTPTSRPPTARPASPARSAPAPRPMAVKSARPVRPVTASPRPASVPPRPAAPPPPVPAAAPAAPPVPAPTPPNPAESAAAAAPASPGATTVVVPPGGGEPATPEPAGSGRHPKAPAAEWPKGFPILALLHRRRTGRRR